MHLILSSPNKFSPTLIPSQIIRLPDRHALRTKNIIRSHKMEVEIRDRPIQRIVCSFLVSFLFSPRLFILPDPTSSRTSKKKIGKRTLSRELHLSRPSLKHNLLILVLINILFLHLVSPSLLVPPPPTSHKSNFKRTRTHLHTLQKLNRLRNPLEQLLKRLLVILKRHRLNFSNTDREAL
jgi:hypothetical protein